MAKFLKYKDQLQRINFDLILSYNILNNNEVGRLDFILQGKIKCISWFFETKKQAEECLRWLDEKLIDKDENELTSK